VRRNLVALCMLYFVYMELLPLALALLSFTEITGVKVESRPESTIVVLQLSGPARFSSSKLSHPDRAIFDFPGSRPSIEGRREATIKVDDPRLLSVRIGETMAGTTRIVLDLTANVTLTPRPAGNQVLIELFSSPREDVAPRAETGAGSVPGPADTMQRNSSPAADAVPIPRNLFSEFSAADSLPAVVFPSTRAGNGTYRIVIDPGHGGQDGGTAGPIGQQEKDIALEISLRTAELLRRQPRTEVRLTRTADLFVPLSQRTTFANSAHADLLVSIHASWPPSSAQSAAEIYYLGLSEAPEDLSIAGRENATGEKTLADFGDLIKSISQNGKMAESKLLAEDVMSALDSLAVARANKLGQMTPRRAPLLVLVGAGMPAIVANVESGNSTASDTNSGSSAFREKVASALYLGIMKYKQAAIASSAQR
jgi:N-acetylmuramoyl-L-alanine amidase